MSNLRAIQEARYVYERAEFMDRQALLDAAISLAEWGLFSKRHIAAITGVRWPTISGLLTKTDKSGGRFEPEGLKWVEQYLQSGIVEYLVTAAFHCSPGLIGKFAEEPEWTIRRKIERYQVEAAA